MGDFVGCIKDVTWKAYSKRDQNKDPLLVCSECAKDFAHYGARVEEMTQVEILRAKIAGLEADAKNHERDKQEAYEQGMMQREGPDELSEKHQEAWHRLEDRMRSNTCGELDSDLHTLMHALTILRDRLAVRNEKIQELYARLEKEAMKPIPMLKLDDGLARLLTLERVVSSVREQRDDWMKFDREDEISYGYAVECLTFALDEKKT
jgi:chromosome segregation ATPase